MEAANSQSSDSVMDTLSVDGTALVGTSLSSLSSNDLEHLTELSDELQLVGEMDTSEEVIENEEEVQCEVVQPEFGTQEVEIETEHNQSSEDVVPEIKIKPGIPPLRPLTIAPKPAKLPIASIKSAGGQQLILLQGSAGGQPLKIISPQGQSINVASLSNLSLGKPVALRPANKTLTTNAMSVFQPKQVIMKKITTTTKAIVDGKTIEKVEPVTKTTQNVVIQSPGKTITLAQAQQLGLLTGQKFASPFIAKQTITTAAGKLQPKTFKVIPQFKPHTKILPAPQSVASGKPAQRVIFKTANSNSSIVGPAQIMVAASSQPLIAGQLHQINIPGKGVQYIKLVTSTTNSNATVSTASVVSVNKNTEAKLSGVSTVSNSNTTKVANVVLSEALSTPNIAPKPLKPNTIVTRPGTVHLPSNQLVVLPAYLPPSNPKVAIPVKPKPPPSEPLINVPIPDVNMESNGIRPRKPCNCTKSQCLKLYCDCFANGEFCNMCNCMNCLNNLDHEEHRQRAIKSCLERNPSAFRPKIGKAKDISGDVAIRKHTKGCNCKRSGCLKNYCECYEAKIACSSNCKCVSCRNVEDSLEDREMRSIANVPIPTCAPILSAQVKVPRNIVDIRPRRLANSGRHAFNYINNDVIEATCQCLLAISDAAQSDGQDEEITKGQIIEEFGRCLKEIIGCSLVIESPK